MTEQTADQFVATHFARRRERDSDPQNAIRFDALPNLVDRHRFVVGLDAAEFLEPPKRQNVLAYLVLAKLLGQRIGDQTGGVGRRRVAGELDEDQQRSVAQRVLGRNIDLGLEEVID